jgi:hypothetical protein
MNKVTTDYFREKNKDTLDPVCLNEVWQLVGVVDAYDAVHFVEVRDSEDPPYHAKLWPTAQKRWRFYLRQWELDKSVLSTQELTDENCEAIERAIRKKFTPPRWYLWGEFWDQNGRPQHGKERDKLIKKFEKIHGKCKQGEFLY